MSNEDFCEAEELVDAGNETDVVTCALEVEGVRGVGYSVRVRQIVVKFEVVG